MRKTGLPCFTFSAAATSTREPLRGSCAASARWKAPHQLSGSLLSVSESFSHSYSDNAWSDVDKRILENL